MAPPFRSWRPSSPGATSALKTGPGLALNCLVQRTVALAMARSRPRLGELEVPDPRNSSEVSTVVGHEDQPRLTARQRQEDVVPKCHRKAVQLQPFASYEVGQNDPRLFPCAGPRVQRCALGAQTRSARGAGACGDRPACACRRAAPAPQRHSGTRTERTRGGTSGARRWQRARETPG